MLVRALRMGAAHLVAASMAMMDLLTPSGRKTAGAWQVAPAPTAASVIARSGEIQARDPDDRRQSSTSPLY
ncbi:MAG: hypothetical protein ACLVB5_00735 [Christensenellales bacterium]